MQVQTEGALSGAATEEFVLLKNTSSEPIHITNWCIEYSSLNDNVGFEVCVEAPDETTEIWLEADGLLSFSTQSFVDINMSFNPDYLMSGGMASASGHLRLWDAEGIEIDKVGWGSAVNPEGVAVNRHLVGEVLSRNFEAEHLDTDMNNVDFTSTTILSVVTSGVYEEERLIDVCLNIDGLQLEVPVGYATDEEENCYEDFCLNIDGLQLVAPDGYEKTPEEGCTVIPLEDAKLVITELYPNAPSVDTGQEFIEFYNPGDKTVELLGYVLQVGPTFTKEVVLESGFVKAGEYITFSDAETGLILPNSSGVELRLVAPAGNLVSESPIYSDAQDDESWSLIDDQWIWTNQITPGNSNKLSVVSVEKTLASTTSTFGPCPEGKFRNPETNRCKNIETAVSQLVPCDEDEFRNPETNRCNKISSSSSTLTPCKPGQVRNPETNRCRSISSTSSLKPCPEGQERNPETNRCRTVTTLNASSNITPAESVMDVPIEQVPGQINWLVISLAVGGTFLYMMYEWRVEIIQKYRQVRLARN